MRGTGHKVTARVVPVVVEDVLYRGGGLWLIHQKLENHVEIKLKF